VRDAVESAGARELYDWHPAEEERIFRLHVVLCEGRRKLIREAV